jgi:large subunit ribosomal protein L17
MTKNLGRRKLSVNTSHRLAMMRNMATSLFLHEKIETTFARAKSLSSFAEKLITAAKPADLNARREVERDIKDQVVLKKLFDVIAPRYKERHGGYTKVLKTGVRVGDNAKTAIIKLIA